MRGTKRLGFDLHRMLASGRMHGVAAAVVGTVAAAGASYAGAQKTAGAAEDAADAQQQSAANSVAYQRESRDLARSDLRPFVNFATGSINPYQGTQAANQPLISQQPIAQNRANFDADAYLAANPDVADPNNWRSQDPFLHWQMYGNKEGRAFTPNADATRSSNLPASGYATDSPLGMLSNLFTQQGQTDYLSNNPLFKIGMDKLNRTSSNTFLGRGQVGSANNQIVQNAFLAGQPLLQQQTNNLFNAANLGQSSAAGQANAALTTGAGVAGTLEGAGNSQAAGIIGAGNAQAAGYQGIGNAVGSGLGAYAAYNNAGYGSGNTVPSIYGNQGVGMNNPNQMVA